MLVIRRKPGETLVIGNQIRVTVLETRGGTVKIGIEAPPEFSIHRSEVVDPIEQANRAAGSVAPDQKLAQQLPRRPARDE